MLRDPTTVTNRERRPILAEMARQEDLKDVPLGQQTLERVRIAEMYVQVLVKSWSFELPVPSADPSSLDEVPGLDHDTLCMAVQDPESSLFLDVGSKPDPKGQSDPVPNSGNSVAASPTTTSGQGAISLDRSGSTA
jgi:hypothetical protein